MRLGFFEKKLRITCTRVIVIIEVIKFVIYLINYIFDIVIIVSKYC